MATPTRAMLLEILIKRFMKIKFRMIPRMVERVIIFTKYFGFSLAENRDSITLARGVMMISKERRYNGKTAGRYSAPKIRFIMNPPKINIPKIAGIAIM